jgi:hypothetical protein
MPFEFYIALGLALIMAWVSRHWWDGTTGPK